MTENVPEAARGQVRGLVEGLSELYGDALVGVYLHGSLVLGCFNPQPSDIDVIAVTTRPATTAERRRLSLLLPACSAPKSWPRADRCPLELTILTRSNLRPWRHPSPFDLHYSESHPDTAPGATLTLPRTSRFCVSAASPSPASPSRESSPKFPGTTMPTRCFAISPGAVRPAGSSTPC